MKPSHFTVCVALLVSVACGGRASAPSGPDSAPGAATSDDPARASCPPAGSGPQVLASGQEGVFDVKVAGGEVFWSTGTQVSKVSVCGGPVTTVATFVPNSFTFLAIAGDDVYFTDNAAGISRVPRAGGTTTLVGTGSVTLVAAGGGFVAWDNGTGLARATIADGSTTSFSLRGAPSTGSAYTFVTALALDTKAFYWTDLSSGELIRVPFDGGASSTLANAMSSEQGLVVDDQNAYWVVTNAPTAYPVFESGPPPPTSTSSNVYRVSLAGGTVASLAAGYDFRGPVTDADRVYWLDAYAGEVESVPLGGGSVSVLASGEVLESSQGTLSAVHAGPALDDDAVYWATEDGEIRRIAKPTR